MKSKFDLMQVISSSLLILILVIFVLIIFNRHTDGEILQFSLNQGKRSAEAIVSGVIVEQTFVAQENYLCRLDILLSHYTEPDDSPATIELLDERDNVIFSETVPVHDIAANSYRTIEFDSVPDSKGKTFRLIFRCDADGWTHSLAAWCTDDNEYTEGRMLINGNEVTYDIVFKTYSSMSGFSKQLLADSLLCILIATVVLFLYHIILIKFNNNLIKLFCWVLCSFFVSLTVMSIYLKVSGKFVHYNLFESIKTYNILIILPLIMMVCSTAFGDSEKLGNKATVKKWVSQTWKEMFPFLITDGVFGFMLLIYEPILIYASNKNDFKFHIGTMMPFILLTFVFGFITILSFSMVAYIIIKMFSKNLNIFYCIAIGCFVIFFATYIQGNWLAGDLPVLTGDAIQWDSFLNNDVITIIIWFALIVSAICFSVKFTPCKVYKTMGAISATVFLMLAVALLAQIPTVMGDNKSTNVEFLPTTKNFNTISSDKNFLIFLVDTVDSMTFNNVMESNPKYKELLKDFTFYDNVVSLYPFTTTSVPNILTGKVFKREYPTFHEFSNYAFNNSELFSLLTENDYDINLYDEHEIRWNCDKNFEIKNTASSYSTNAFDFFYEQMKYVSFKYLPYALKIYSHIETADYNKTFQCTEQLWDDDNLACYNEIINNPQLQIQEKPMFQFVHTFGAHPPFTYDRDFNSGSDFTYEQAIECSLTVISAYIQRLKENNVYDNSVIIIMADHGYRPGTDSNDGPIRPGFLRFNPILLIKGIHESHEYTVLEKPLSYALDLQNAYKDLLEGKSSVELFSDIADDRKRTVLWYWLTDWSEFVEYEVKGKAWEWEKYEPTGNVF